ncbi:MAG: hypothetical protein V4448_05305 [Pseudomonadota bacterium]
MAESVRTLLSIAGMLCALSLSLTASAQQLQDPTRPSGVNDLGGAMSADGGPVLQSVLISSGRRVAVISGQTVKLGEQFGGARVVKIVENEVVLRNGNELQTLKLFPSLGKKLMSNRVDQNPDNRK